MKSNPQIRDRVIFVSLVDILLQLVFVLLIVILYVFNDYQRILVINQNNESCPANLTSCKEIEKKLEDKIKELEKLATFQQEKIDELNKGNLIACIPASTTSEKTSLTFKAISPSTLAFTGFTTEYLAYIEQQNYRDKLLQAKQIHEGKVFSIKDIEMNFGFVRQKNCYHVARVIDPSGVMPSKQIDFLRNQVRKIIRQRNVE